MEALEASLHRTIPWLSYGGVGAVSYERGTPVGEKGGVSPTYILGVWVRTRPG